MKMSVAQSDSTLVSSSKATSHRASASPRSSTVADRSTPDERGTQRSSEAIRADEIGTQRSSEAIRADQKSSEVISGTCHLTHAKETFLEGLELALQKPLLRLALVGELTQRVEAPFGRKELLLFGGG